MTAKKSAIATPARPARADSKSIAASAAEKSKPARAAAKAAAARPGTPNITEPKGKPARKPKAGVEAAPKPEAEEDFSDVEAEFADSDAEVAEEAEVKQARSSRCA